MVTLVRDETEPPRIIEPRAEVSNWDLVKRAWTVLIGNRN